MTNRNGASGSVFNLLKDFSDTRFARYDDTLWDARHQRGHKGEVE